MRFGVAAVLLWACAAQAQPVYRCGPEGREWSQLPCAGARQESLPAVRRPSDAEVAAARDVARRDAALARELQADREALEHQPRAKPGFFGARAAAGPASAASAVHRPHRRRHHPARADEFIAVEPVGAKKKP